MIKTKYFKFLGVLLLLVNLLGSLHGQSAAPNIVVFFVDDLGWQDTSEPFYKNETPINRKFNTPHLEQLAKESTKFTNAYATPVCTPSRVSFLTGLNAAHHKVTNWTHPLANRPTDNSDEMLTPPEWNINGLSPDGDVPHTVAATPLPALLKQAGYFTIHVGKAHWGAAGTPGANPSNLGFIVNIAGHSAGHPQSYYGEDNYGNIPGKASYQAVPGLMEYYGTDTFLTDALTKEAIKAMEEPIKRKEPFFLHFSNYAVHVPIQSDPRFFQRYIDSGLDSTEAAYASLVEGYDQSIGDVVQFLKQRGVYDNTVIVFVSDNGGLSIPPMRSGEIHTQNLPLRAGKGSLYEGGIRVPLIVKSAAGTKPKTEDSPVIMEDLFPTLLDVAKVEDPQLKQGTIDGVSLVPLLEGSKNNSWKERALVWHFPNKWTKPDGPGINFFSAVRKDNYKLVYNMKKSKVELFDLAKDIGEKDDIATRNKTKCDELSKILSDKLRAWGAQMPVYKQGGNLIPYPDEL